MDAGDASRFRRAAWDPKGQRIYCGTRQKIEMYASDGQPIWSQPGRAADAALSPSGELIVGADPDNHITIWHTATGAVARRFNMPLEQEFQRAHWHHDGARVVVYTC